MAPSKSSAQHNGIKNVSRAFIGLKFPGYPNFRPHIQEIFDDFAMELLTLDAVESSGAGGSREQAFIGRM
jgi:hypothetical protein